MLKVIDILSLDFDDIQVYKSLRQPVEHFRKGIFIAEGEKVVMRLLESPLQVISLLLTPDWFDKIYFSLEKRSEEILVYRANKKLLEEIVGFHLHQGIMALGKIPELKTLDSVIAHLSPPFFFAALDGLTNSENIGVIVRNCAAFGVQALIVGETSSSPFLRRAVRNSMGAVFNLPIIHCSNLKATLLQIHNRHQFYIIGAHPHGETDIFPKNLSSESCCIVFGSEGEGISSEVLKICNARVRIPMANGIDSLNVSSACAVFLYEIQRQRKSVS